MSKIRLDLLLVQQAIVETRAKAQALIMTGRILVNEQKITKAGAQVKEDAVIRVIGEKLPYVSRGGLKLEGALKSFNFNPEGLMCLDVGASTGGFTDCLLQNGAKHIVALDVGHSQLDWKIRSDERVTVVEKCNFRYLTKEDYLKLTNGGFLPQLVVIDVSFISLDKILPPLYNILEPGSYVISLVKPQFEAQREQVGKGGIIKDSKVHEQVMDKVKNIAQECGYEYLDDDISQIKGTDGNKEYFIFLRKPNV